jgi:hypothetical protein
MTVARTEPLFVKGITLVPSLEPGNILRVQVHGLRAGPYRVEASENVRPSNWQLLTNGTAGAGQVVEFTESTASPRLRRFYRVSQ